MLNCVICHYKISLSNHTWIPNATRRFFFCILGQKSCLFFNLNCLRFLLSTLKILRYHHRRSLSLLPDRENSLSAFTLSSYYSGGAIPFTISGLSLSRPPSLLSSQRLFSLLYLQPLPIRFFSLVVYHQLN